MLSNQEVLEANRFMKDLIALNSKPRGSGMYVFPSSIFLFKWIYDFSTELI